MIEIRNLVVEFGAMRAVDHLDLHVPRGVLFGLLGPNGAGKSTTISCIAGLLNPTSGTIRVAGEPVVAGGTRIQRIMGVVPQSLALYRELTVLQNLRIFGGLFGLKGRSLSDRIAWGLELAQLTGRTDTRVEQLSGGMQRRLNLACSLLHDPELIICDEPTTGVDPQSRNHLFETIRTLHAEGRTVIYTTHYMEEVEALAQQVAIMDAGRIIANDSLETLLGQSGETTRFEVTVPTARSAESLREAHALDGATIAPKRRSLEDVFLELTGRELRESP